MLHRPACTSPRSRAGFTLVEILAVLAIVGLVASVVFLGSGALLRAAQHDDAETGALSALAATRRAAVLSGQVVELRVDEQARVLSWGEETLPLAGEGTVRLLPMETSAVLLGGRRVERSVAAVRFYPDGTCDPFRVEILRGEASRILTVDPWTCAVMAPAAPSAR